MKRFTDDYLLYLLAQASDVASADFHAHLAAEGIAVSTWRILATLYPDAPAGVSALAQSCLTKQSTMTRRVDRLVGHGLVDRIPSAEDRRRVAVQLTETGRALAARLAAKAKSHEAGVLAGFDPEQIGSLKTILKSLRQLNGDSARTPARETSDAQRLS